MEQQKRRVVAKKMQDRESPLSPGDRIEIGISGEVNGALGKLWPRFGVTSQVREGEAAEEAVERVSDYVMQTFDENVEAVKG